MHGVFSRLHHPNLPASTTVSKTSAWAAPILDSIRAASQPMRGFCLLHIIPSGSNQALHRGKRRRHPRSDRDNGGDNSRDQQAGKNGVFDGFDAAFIAGKSS